MATATIFDFLLNQQRDAGNALVNGTVTFYSAGTTSPKTVWADSIASTEAPNPYTLDSRAAAVVYGIGNYKLVLKNASGVTVATWDNVYAGADLSSIDLSTLIAAASFSNRDYIGNSRFNIWNNGTSFSTSTIGSTVTADGWWYSTNGSGAGVTAITRQSFTYGQTEVESNPLYYTRVQKTVASTGATYETFSFRLPIQTLSSEEVTFRFYAKTATSTDVTVSCVQNFGTGGSTTVTTTSSAITVDTDWTRFYKTFTVPSIAGKTVGASAYLEIGLSFTPNITYDVSIAQCKFETGTVAGDEEPRTVYEDDIRTSGTIATRNSIILADTLGDLDEKYWRLNMDITSDTLTLAALNDSQANSSAAIVVERDGYTVEELTLYNSATSVNVTDAANTVADVSAAATGFASLKDALDAKAPINSPTFTGNPKAPTLPATDSSTNIATTAYVTAVAFNTALPGQAGNAGKFVTTDGTNAGWANVISIPFYQSQGGL